MTLLELAGRCEQATGPERELDIAIHTKTSGFPPRNGGVGWPKGALVVPMFPGWKPLPAYTASLDAAMTLVPEGSHVFLNGYKADNFWNRARVQTFRQEGETPDEAKAATLALALCAAALRARAAQGIETRSAIDAKRRGPKGESPVREANAPNLPPYPSTD